MAKYNKNKKPRNRFTLSKSKEKKIESKVLREYNKNIDKYLEVELKKYSDIEVVVD